MNDAPSSPSPEALRTAAERLVATLAAHDDGEYRATVLRRLARQLAAEAAVEARRAALVDMHPYLRAR